jgi:hypothetical protein
MKISRLKTSNENKINEKTKMLELKLNETIQQLGRIELLHKQSSKNRLTNKLLKNMFFSLEFTEGNECGCLRWCNERGSPYGLCGDGHICICTATPIDKDSLGMI